MSTASPHARPELDLPRGRDSAETKSRLLDAASQLFAERGYSATSLRAVTQAAGVSVSAANYHFGSKLALLHATLGRVIAPVNAERIDRLDALEREAGPAGLSPEAILEAFLAPAVERRDASSGTDTFRRLTARLYSDPPDIVAAFKEESFGPLSERFLAALQRALPGRSERELEIAFQFLVGMMVYVISGQPELAPHSQGRLGAPPDDAEMLAQLVRFGAAGLRATTGRGAGSANDEESTGCR